MFPVGAMACRNCDSVLGSPGLSTVARIERFSVKEMNHIMRERGVPGQEYPKKEMVRRLSEDFEDTGDYEALTMYEERYGRD